MNILVLYESQTGTTRQYAQWIAEALHGEALPLKEATPDRVRQADRVLFGGSVRGSLISGQEKMARLAKRAGGKDVLFFCVGIRPATARTLDLLRRNNFGSASETPLFYLRGSLDKETLAPGDRTLLRVYEAMLKRRRDLHPEDEELLRILRVPGSYVHRDQILPLLEAVGAVPSLP